VKFGFGLITCQRYPGDTRSDVELYRVGFELAVEAERLGYDSVWVSEHHFWNDAYMPALLPVCAAIGAQTSRITIGTAVLLAPLYEPLRLAEDAAVVDLISAGRLVLGLGQGWREEEFEALRVPLSQRAVRLENTIATLRQAWSGDAVSGGRTISYPEVRVTPTPTRPEGPPFWIGAGSKPAVQRAARIADGHLGNFEAPPDVYARQVGWIRETLAEHNQTDAAAFTFALHLPTFVVDGPNAWELVRDHHYYVNWKYFDMADARSRTGPPERPPALTAEREADLRARIVVGTPDEVVERLRQYHAVVGDDLHFVARMYWPGMDIGLQRETMSVFAERVIPQLRG
jgi:alkanesulfonate monooxygenase SsuD/methylene tetrahydromethanopterin reductase-like flavin-dependent oxidoreductase (luciferase family)